MPMNKNNYPSNWKKVSLAIRRVAGWRCEWCGVANGALLPSGRPGKVVLTVAHIGAPFTNSDGNKHDKHDIRRENLRALCQKCHLTYDLQDHIQHAKQTRNKKKQQAREESGQLSFFDLV